MNLLDSQKKTIEILDAQIAIYKKIDENQKVIIEILQTRLNELEALNDKL